MENMKSLADQLREELGKPGAGNTKKGMKSKPAHSVPAILQAIMDYDNSDHKSMVHARFTTDQVALMARFKIATNIDTTKLVAFAVKYLFDQHPELKKAITQFMQNSNL
ncbi:hypothetical protein ACRQ5D_34165 [Mucilaginibacter sp. P25]|uniref:hypothetical protein n=1 Tax=Mucilaginibacter sp. P25 TaxID=3423945 RepID=UPI003D79BDFD